MQVAGTVGLGHSSSGAAGLGVGLLAVPGIGLELVVLSDFVELSDLVARLALRLRFRLDFEAFPSDFDSLLENFL